MRRVSLIAVVLGLGLALLLSLGTSSETGDQPECTVTLSPGESIQQEIDRASEGAVICLAAGNWKENVIIEKGLTLRAAEVKPEPDVVIQSAEASWPVILIRSEEAIEVVLQGLKVTGALGLCYKEEPEWICADGVSVHGQAKAVIHNSTISGNWWGIWMSGSSQATIQNSTFSNNKWYGILMWDSSQATIEHNTISGNKEDGILMWGSSQATIGNNSISSNEGDGIDMWDSSQATIQNNKIVNNGEYGVACYQRPCFDTYEEFKGAVRGSGNEISGNRKADVCPTKLQFLMTSTGGCYGAGC